MLAICASLSRKPGRLPWRAAPRRPSQLVILARRQRLLPRFRFTMRCATLAAGVGGAAAPRLPAAATPPAPAGLAPLRCAADCCERRTIGLGLNKRELRPVELRVAPVPVGISAAVSTIAASAFASGNAGRRSAKLKDRRSGRHAVPSAEQVTEQAGHKKRKIRPRLNPRTRRIPNAPVPTLRRRSISFQMRLNLCLTRGFLPADRATSARAPRKNKRPGIAAGPL